MITAHSKSIVSRRVRVRDGDMPLGELRFKKFASGGSFTVFDDVFEVQSVKRFGMAYLASIGSSVLGRAERKGFFGADYSLQLGRISYDFSGSRPFIGQMVLSEMGREVCRIDRQGLLAPKATIAGNQPLDTEHLMFMLWIFFREIHRGRR